jgi:hypothetical protein
MEYGSDKWGSDKPEGSMEYGSDKWGSDKPEGSDMKGKYFSLLPSLGTGTRVREC